MANNMDAEGKQQLSPPPALRTAQILIAERCVLHTLGFQLTVEHPYSTVMSLLKKLFTLGRGANGGKGVNKARNRQLSQVPYCVCIMEKFKPLLDYYRKHAVLSCSDLPLKGLFCLARNPDRQRRSLLTQRNRVLFFSLVTFPTHSCKRFFGEKQTRAFAEIAAYHTKLNLDGPSQWGADWGAKEG